jgi:N-acyl-D-aspartate/D-glutamate deacylase
MVLFYRTDDDVSAFLRHPLAVVGSDGNAIALEQTSAKPHPRCFGTFPRVLGRYVRERAIVDLPDAIRKMTSEPARRLGIRDRGSIAVGQAADLVVFDPATIGDRATFEHPAEAPVGISHVMVNGTFVLTDGSLTGCRPGTVLRRVAS